MTGSPLPLHRLVQQPQQLRIAQQRREQAVDGRGDGSEAFGGAPL